MDLNKLNLRILNKLKITTFNNDLILNPSSDAPLSFFSSTKKNRSIPHIIDAAEYNHTTYLNPTVISANLPKK